MTRYGAADVAQGGVERILFTVRPKCHFAKPVRPRGKKGDAIQPACLGSLRNVGGWKVQNVLSMHFHFVSAIPHRRRNRDLYTLGRVGQPDDGNTVVQSPLGLVALSNTSDGKNEKRAIFFMPL